jgi:hypothetical protein
MRRFLSFVLYLALGLPLALSSLALIASRPWALDREAYKRFVLDDRLYSVLQAPEIARGAPRTIALEGIELDGRALVAAAQKELPVPELKSTAVKAVDAVFDRVYDPTLRGTVGPLDLGQLKGALASRKTALARDYEAGLSSRSDSPVPADADAQAKAARAIGQAVDSIPAKLSLPAPRAYGRAGGPLGLRLGVLSIGRASGEALTQALLNRMTLMTTAMAGLLVAGLAAMGGKGLLESLARAGRYILFPSAIVLAVGVLLAVPGGLLLQSVLPHGLAGMLGGEVGIKLHELFIATFGPIARDVFITGLVGTSLGALLAQARRIEVPRLEGERRPEELE